ncbi:MAG TPA: SDR family oxidoreductase, partial [Longimicrobiales bacterium]|nr:SDR family oxidoreductase [Longimicrobiales bacterium]
SPTHDSQPTPRATTFPPMSPHGKFALVTGAGHRVGRALALGLARAGASVAVHYNRSEADARETVRLAEARGVASFALRADLSDADACGALVAAAAQRLGGLDILVNSASLFESAAFDEITAEDWDRVQAVNVRAPFLLTRAAAPLLRARRGVVVNIADLAGVQAWRRFAHHGVSKAALIHLTRVSARALAPEVRVNCIVPGTVLPPEDYTEEEVRRAAERAALQRIGTPEDVVEALLFLVRSEFSTGSVVAVDGGRLLT